MEEKLNKELLSSDEKVWDILKYIEKLIYLLIFVLVFDKEKLAV